MGPGMKFNTPALTIEDQQNLLIRRGMEVADPDTARRHLQNISYHRLRAYWYDFGSGA